MQIKMTKITIFSGFLGAGKTTLIQKLIQEGYVGEKLVLIENEFGEIGIDGGFLQDAGVEITEMNSGCICCSLVGDFGKALEKVLEQYHPDRILIEPSGVGKLSDVIRAVQNIHDHEEHEHHHHHDHDEHDENCTCGCHDHDHDHEEHEHHHHHDHDEHDENCTCGCHDHDHEHHHHHADEVFTSWGVESARKYTKEEITNALTALEDTDKYGMILRAKGIVPAEDGSWIHFDYVPGTPDVRSGSAGTTGRLCVIGSGIHEDALTELFHAE